MSTLLRRRTRLLAGVLAVGHLAVLVLAAPALAEPPPEPLAEKDWTFTVTPYLWLPQIIGEVTTRGRTSEIDTSIWDIFAGGGYGIGLNARMEAWRKQRWGFFADGMWMAAGKNSNLNNTLLEFDFMQNVGFVEVGMVGRAFELPLSPKDPEGASWYIDGLAGARVNIVNVRLDFENFRNFNKTYVWADPFLGGRVGFRFGPDNRWDAFVRGDVGGFGAGSDEAWNVIGGFAYAFSVRSTNMSFVLAGRALSIDYENGSFGYDIITYGPVIGLFFPF